MLTALDQVANQNHLQMLKAAIPYFQPQRQRFAAVFAKLLELQNILDFFSGGERTISSCGMGEEGADFSEMLGDIRTYCDPSEQEMIDRWMQMTATLELCWTLSQSADQTGDPALALAQGMAAGLRPAP